MAQALLVPLSSHGTQKATSAEFTYSEEQQTLQRLMNRIRAGILLHPYVLYGLPTGGRAKWAQGTDRSQLQAGIAWSSTSPQRGLSFSI